MHKQEKRFRLEHEHRRLFAGFRVAVLMDAGLGAFGDVSFMQEVLEECAIRLVENNEYFDKLMDDLQHRKQNKIEKKFTKTDAESIFNAIEQGNILEENNGDKK